MDCTPIMLGLVAVTVTPGSTPPLVSDDLAGDRAGGARAAALRERVGRREQAHGQHRNNQMEPSTSHERFLLQTSDPAGLKSSDE